MPLWVVFWVVGSIGVAGWSGYRAIRACNSLGARGALALIALNALLFAAIPFKSFALTAVAQAIWPAYMLVGFAVIIAYIVATNGFKAKVHASHPGLLAKHGIRAGTYPSTSLSQTYKLLDLASCPQVRSDEALEPMARDTVAAIRALIAFALVALFAAVWSYM